MSQPADLILLYLGRFHPLLVHLPIGFLVLLVSLELLALWPRCKTANACAGYVLALAVPASVASAACGWLLALGGGYDLQLLQWHRWMGVGMAGLCCLAGLLYGLGQRRMYFGCLCVTAPVLALTGHLGGSLTHGKDYLSFHRAGNTRARPISSLPFREREVFGEVVQPIFQARCVECHNKQKHKAGLILLTYADLQKGSDNGPVVVAGKAADSPMVQRLLLPLDHEDHMPPEGKPQPTPGEIALIRWWIDAGAPTGQKVGELNPPPELQQMVEAQSASGAEH